MTIHVTTATAPAIWAPYLVNGDATGLEPEELAACDAWQAAQEPAYVVSCTDDESRFTWHYDLYGGTAAGGMVIDYVLHEHAA